MHSSKDRARMDVTVSKNPDIEDVMQDPTAYFDRPDQVAAASGLTTAQKIDVLRSWEVDARQLMAASEENMTGGEKANLDGVLEALKHFGVEPSASDGPSKLGL